MASGLTISAQSAVYLIWTILVIAGISNCFSRGSGYTFRDRLPIGTGNKLNFWSQLAFGMTGLELSPILSGEIRDPQRTIFRATWISAALVVFFYIFGQLRFSLFSRPEQVSHVIGLTQSREELARFWGGGGCRL